MPRVDNGVSKAAIFPFSSSPLPFLSLSHPPPIPHRLPSPSSSSFPPSFSSLITFPLPLPPSPSFSHPPRLVFISREPSQTAVANEHSQIGFSKARGPIGAPREGLESGYLLYRER